MVLMTVKETAKMLKVTRQTIERWIKEGKLKCFKFGRNTRIEKSEIDRFLRSNGNE